jgi:hypothetical protein
MLSGIWGTLTAGSPIRFFGSLWIDDAPANAIAHTHSARPHAAGRYGNLQRKIIVTGENRHGLRFRCSKIVPSPHTKLHSPLVGVGT